MSACTPAVAQRSERLDWAARPFTTVVSHRATSRAAYHRPPVGQRSTTDTVIGIYQAFHTRRTWKQADLARSLNVGTEAVRRVLLELQEKGMPLESEVDRPHVYWSVRKNWFPGSLLFKQEEVPELLRQLRRVPGGQGRSRLLALVLDRLPPGSRDASGASAPVVVPRETTPE